MIWILFLGTMALSLWAAARVKSVYRRYNQVPVRAGVTGAEVAHAILRREGIRDVVAAFITSLAYFLWHLLPLLLGGNRSRD